MEISIIILTYNSSKYIENLLEKLVEKYKEEIKNRKLEIIVADNASTDATVKKAQAFKEYATVLENGDNYGFAKGNNLAVEKAKGDYIVFLNPDTEIVSGDLFELIKEFDDKKIGIVGGRIIRFNNEQEFSVGETYTFPRVFLLSVGLEEKTGVRFRPQNRQVVDFVSGAFLVIRHTLFEKIGGFDEHYFMYVEDADLCLSVKRLGFKVVYSPLVTVRHMGQGSSDRKFAVVNIYKGLLYFHKKHMGSASYNLVKSILKGKATALVLLGKLSNNNYLVETYSEALKSK